MSDERTPRRRKRPAVPEISEVQLQPAQQEPPAPPLRIVVTHEEDTPDWMVSADNTSGAASRRAQKADPAPKKAPPRTRNEAPASTAPKKAKPAPKERPAQKEAAQPAAPAAKRASAPAKPKKKTKKKMSKARIRRIRGTVLAALLLAAAIAVIIFAGMAIGRVLDVKETLDQGDGVFYPNIYVNDIPLEGKTLDQAAQDVTAQVTNKISTWKITLRTQDGRSWDITSGDLNMQYDIADQLDHVGVLVFLPCMGNSLRTHVF